jgi:histidinol-phosphate/aromatic aminotransferase/cobyric acid decarboxylase-like protein
MDNELIIKALKASLTEMTSNSTSENVAKNILSIQLEEQAEEMRQVKNERDEALAELQNIKLGFEEMNKILQSNEQLKNLYEEVKARQIEKG